MHSTLSRKGFLKMCGLALLGAGLDVRLLEAAIGSTADASGPGAAAAGFRLQDATAAHFREHLDTPFHVRSQGGASVPLRLARVDERPATRNVEQFALIFHAPPGRALPDTIHRFHHQGLGDFDLFIVPVGVADARRTVYQACFSRHLSARRQRAEDGHSARRT